MELKKMLVRMMERRGLSRAGLAYALGYKSVTSVTRVMEGACGRESAGEFLQRMLSCEPLDLTAEERRNLLSCLDSRELGAENEGLYEAFGYLLENTYRTCRDMVFRELFARQSVRARRDCARLRIALFNCVDEGLSWEIRRAMEIFEKHRVWVVSDEIWSDLLDARHAQGCATAAAYARLPLPDSGFAGRRLAGRNFRGGRGHADL